MTAFGEDDWMSKVKGSGTEKAPWALETPPRTSDFEVWKDEAADPPALVVQVRHPVQIAGATQTNLPTSSP
jgi:hypothetical protein